MSGKPIYYWDACIYIGWLKKEASDWLSSAEEILRKNYERKNIIITSVITQIEVLECGLTVEQEKVFQALFSPSDHVQYDIDAVVSQKARTLRGHFQSLQAEKKTRLATADAIHLATALTYRAHQFHTNDRGGRKEAETLRSQGLIQLDGQDLAGEILKICNPFVDQLSLFKFNT